MFELAFACAFACAFALALAFAFALAFTMRVLKKAVNIRVVLHLHLLGTFLVLGAVQSMNL